MGVLKERRVLPGLRSLALLGVDGSRRRSRPQVHAPDDILLIVTIGRPLRNLPKHLDSDAQGRYNYRVYYDSKTFRAPLVPLGRNYFR